MDSEEEYPPSRLLSQERLQRVNPKNRQWDEKVVPISHSGLRMLGTGAMLVPAYLPECWDPTACHLNLGKYLKIRFWSRRICAPHQENRRRRKHPIRCPLHQSCAQARELLD